MGETMVIDGKKGLKRKRGSPSMAELLRKEEKEIRIAELRKEMEGLFGYFKEVREEEKEKEKMGVDLIGNRNSAIAVLLEGSSLPLSKLVDEVFNKVKDGGGSVASVRSDVLLIGQRSMYGLRNVDADVLEDDSGSCLWCWETRDIKLIPKSMRGPLKIRRTCRKKIHERITAVYAMINVLQKSSDQTCGQELTKASERLSKVLSGADIPVLISSMIQKNGAELAVKEGIREKNMMIKQMERHKREVEKEKKRLDLEHQKEKLQSEKELRRLQAEAEREEKRCEKEESELRKQLKKQQEEAEREERRREKEEAELKKQLALQKQASLMERFLKKSKNSSPSQKEPSPTKTTSTDASCARSEKKFEPVTLSMDSALSQYDGIDIDDIWKLHLNSWRSIGHSIRSNRKEHWGIRRIPKTELVKELKLTTTRQFHHEDEFCLEKLDDGWDESGNTHSKCKQYLTNPDVSLPTGQKFKRKKQLLQFDKSHRPAFYGTWPKQSQVIGPRHPFVQDPDLDYDIDSDEEWEEEEPGESLSDCNKDDLEESLEEGLSKVEEDESEDGFFVPDGYLSENEGVQDFEMDCKNLVAEARSSPSCKQVESEDLSVFFRQQKYLHNATEHALRKNNPLIISNFLNKKLSSTLTVETTSMLDIEQTCLLALSMRVFPGFPSLEISVVEDVQEQNLEASPSSSKGNTTPVSTASAVLDSDLRQIVSVIQSCSSGINKVVESLHLKFPTVPKTQLSKKVREISDFKDNRWQIKKDILNKLGLSPSPEISHAKTKSIVSLFSKRCLPLVGKSQNPSDTSPQSAQKTESATQLQQNYTHNHT